MNYGSWPSHSCFSYERYNQDLIGIRTNSKQGLERTVFKRMLSRIHREDLFNSISSVVGNSTIGEEEGFDVQLSRLISGEDINGNHERYVNTNLLPINMIKMEPIIGQELVVFTVYHRTVSIFKLQRKNSRYRK